MPKRLCFFILLFCTALCAAFGRDITVTVIDDQIDMPLEGASIRAQDGKMYVCNREGEAVVTIPDNLEFSLEVVYPGYQKKIYRVKNDDKTRYTIGLLILGETLENEELVVQGVRAEEENTNAGRSISMTRENIEMTAEIGAIEDIMSSIKLLPGVGYAGVLSAQPSIRGGTPGDLEAVMNGYYIDFPYHWGGSYSIFDPKMVETARLYHGVFSVRYGHTISGLLEVKSKKPSSEETEFEMGVSTSAASLGISYPLYSGTEARGGIMLMGKVTYWDPFVWLAQGLSYIVKELEPVRVVNVAPYIRCLSLMVNYNWTADMETLLNVYIGGDGIGLLYQHDTMGLIISNLQFDWNNLIGFFSAALNYYPSSTTFSKTTLGAGFHYSGMEADMSYRGDNIFNNTRQTQEANVLSVQVREDFDWDLTKGFLFSAGIEELYRKWIRNTESNLTIAATDPKNPSYVVNIPYYYPKIDNSAFFTSLWALLEYKDPLQRFDVEAGLRADILSFFVGDVITDCPIALNPRINFDYFLFRDAGFINLLTLTAGVGLFSSTNDAITSVDKTYGIGDNTIKQNRAITGIIGTKLDFADDYTFNLEFYYKYIFDRSYTVLVSENNEFAVTKYYFDGESHVFGFDLMLQKIKGRFLSGWISYSFVYARYNDPQNLYAFNFARFKETSDHWYFPDFHRFSNLNVVLNWAPMQRLNIYTRLGFASGVPVLDYGNPTQYDVVENGKTVKRWKRTNYYSDTFRSDFSIPLDIKFSWYFFNPGGKVQTEVYLACENALSLIYRPRGGTTMNPYTGKEEEGSASATYDLPIPMVSFGFKWSY
ncbi:MAG: TonB-dependent receptor plug domain-containing protein [Spirochaetaceae bacterium]|jgi:hypothetical protein|nr:TonB-dependent receptor plug domain-containing protein [Spirochaetaceae bacterium]